MKNLARPTLFATFACLIGTAGCVRDAEDYTTTAVTLGGFIRADHRNYTDATHQWL